MRKAPEVADEVLELIKKEKVRSLGQIGEAVGVRNLKKLEKFLELVEGMRLIERGYRLTDLGEASQSQIPMPSSLTASALVT